jgi:uncharacterized protein
LTPTAWEQRFDGLETEALGDDLVLHTARAFDERRRGLAKMEAMPPHRALRILRTNSVHTFGMRFPLDLVWLGRHGAVLRVDRDVPARRVKLCVRARSVVETRAGHGDRFARALD